MNRAYLIFLAALFPLLSQAQGFVNVNNRGLNPAQLVLDDSGQPLAGPQMVAQIVYGRDAASMTNTLGDPMPFRTGTLAGAWNPSPNSTRTLDGFTEGQTVFMRVYAWDPSQFSSFDQVRAHTFLYWSCRAIQNYFGASDIYTYVVGNSSQPAGTMVNFRSFRTWSTHVWPESYVVDVLGGPWVRHIEAVENVDSVSINLLDIPVTQMTNYPALPVTMPPGTGGNEPLGWAIRSITAGNPLNLTMPPDPVSGDRVAADGYTETVELTSDQASAETSLVSVQGTVSNTVIRLKKPFIGRVVLQLRYPLNPELVIGCFSHPRNIVLDIKPANNPVRMAIHSNTAPNLRLKLETLQTHTISSSSNLVTWTPVATYSVGYADCVPIQDGCSGTWSDPDRGSRFGDFTIPIQSWLQTNGAGTVFFKLESR